jgi:4-carboxymuconolactone decarboxylase
MTAMSKQADKTPRAESALRAKGRAMRRKLVGDAYADELDKGLYTDPIMEKFAELTQEMLFGTLWSRPGLDLKTRTLITLVSDAATGRTTELKVHLRFARNHGWTEDELVESLLHLLGYVGAPLVREALIAATEVFAEMRAEEA